MCVGDVDYILCGLSSIRLSAAVLRTGVKDLISELVGSAEPVSPQKSLQSPSWAGTKVSFLYTEELLLTLAPTVLNASGALGSLRIIFPNLTFAEHAFSVMIKD